MAKSSCLWILQGVCSTSGNIMRMYHTNFNMPVPLLFNGSGDCTSGFMAARYVDMCDTSHALAGTWYPGYEFALGDSMYLHDGPLNGLGCVYQLWKVDGSPINSFNFQLCIDQGADSWAMYESMVNTGIAGWEIDSNSTVTFQNQITSISGDDISIAAKTGTVILSNVPNTAQCSSTITGSIWVEGNELAYINSARFKHKILGYYQITPAGTPGSIWIDNTHYLNWIGADTNVYKAPWRICQFCSSFTNGAPDNPSPGAGYAGNIWVDNQFGCTHLSYIGCDGNKYLAGAGLYPYT